MLSNIIKAFVLIIFMCIIFTIIGCETIKVTEFSTGCKIVDSSLQAGLVNSQGAIESCKLVCSPELPPGFKYKYEARGCTAEVHNVGS